MKIINIKTTALLGETPDTGWAAEPGPGSNLHTLVEVHTDEGITGIGSVFTSQLLVDASLALLEPFVKGENALAFGGLARVGGSFFLSGGLSVGVDEGNVGGRAGFMAEW